jgi:hypothetical protein
MHCQEIRHLIRPTWTGRRIRLVIAVFAAVAGCLVQPCAAQSGQPENEIVEPELLWRLDPELRMPEAIRRLSSSNLPLWIESLAGPEHQLRRDVAMDITRAHRDGYLDCSTAATALSNALNDASSPRSVLVEIARALITLDAKASSPKFKELLAAGSGTQFEVVVEPALARWGDAEMLKLWQQRLTADDVRRRRLLAIRSIAALPHSMTTGEQLHADLQALIENGREHGLAMEAARTLGQVKRSGLEPLAERLLESPSDTSQTQLLSGIYLLLHHESELSHDLLLRAVAASLVDPGKAAIVRAAWQRLLDQNVAELSSQVPEAIRHSDPEVRRVAIDTIVRFPTSERVALLGIALDDRHPEIRRAARHGLLTLSRDDSLKPAIIQAGLAAIARSSWREQEQAIVLLAMLNQTNMADRMLQLVDSPRGEVAIAAAWGLRKLNVAEKLKRLLEMAEVTDKQIADGQELRPHQSIVLAHIFEALGRGNYKPAIPLLKRWIPKADPRLSHENPRSSAVWSLGWFFENSKDSALAQQLKARFVDVFPAVVSESTSLRYAAGIALGRIGALEVVPDLELFAALGGEYPDLAAAWAVERLTGEVIPPPDPRIDQGAPWSIAPIGSRQEADATAR